MIRAPSARAHQFIRLLQVAVVVLSTIIVYRAWSSDWLAVFAFAALGTLNAFSLVWGERHL